MAKRTVWSFFRTSVWPQKATARAEQKLGMDSANSLSLFRFCGSNTSLVRQTIVSKQLLHCWNPIGRFVAFSSCLHISSLSFGKGLFTSSLTCCCVKVFRKNKSGYFCIPSRSRVFLDLLFRQSFEHVPFVINFTVNFVSKKVISIHFDIQN